MLIVEKLPWANTLDVTKGVEEALDELRPGLPGSRSTPPSSGRPPSSRRDRQPHPRAAARRVLVIWSSVLFLFEWRTALISVVAIPLSLLAAVLVLDPGATINTMILAGS